MTSHICQYITQAYSEWFASDIVAEASGDVCVLTVPFIDRHRDFLQVYIAETAEGLVISDDGYVIRDLRISGLDIETSKRQETLDEILNSFGISKRQDELFVIATENNLAQRNHDLVQAMLAVGDLIHLAQPTAVSAFKKDVQRYLALKEIPFTVDVHLQGESGLNHGFDIVIGSSNEHPEQYLRAINAPNRENIVELIFSWQDVQKARPPGSQPYVILNDESQRISKSLLDALDVYKIKSILWSDRERQFNVFEYSQQRVSI